MMKKYDCDICGGGMLDSKTMVYYCPFCGGNHNHGWAEEEEVKEESVDSSDVTSDDGEE